MNYIQHPPWIGNLFAKSATRRLLILGESHRGDDPDEVNMTIPVVEEWLSGVSNPAYRFFTHLAVALSGQEPWQIDRRAVFQHVAFYNYVGRVMPGSRVAPSQDDFVRSEAAFREVVELLQPTHIAVCGSRLWDAMPHFDPPDPDGYHFMLGDKKSHLGRYRTASAAPLAICIRHPQSGFNGRRSYRNCQTFSIGKPYITAPAFFARCGSISKLLRSLWQTNSPPPASVDFWKRIVSWISQMPIVVCRSFYYVSVHTKEFDDVANSSPGKGVMTDQRQRF